MQAKAFLPDDPSAGLSASLETNCDSPCLQVAGGGFKVQGGGFRGEGLGFAPLALLPSSGGRV